MKFVVDSMLGKLAKRLRLLGYDTLYDAKADDKELLKTSKMEGRWLVTRDTQIAKIHGAKVLLIKSTDIQEQLKEISKLTGIKLNEKTAFSRCSECNTPIEGIAKEKVKSRVPKLVYETMDEFSHCPKCGKVYWKGTHFDRLREQLGSF